MGSGFSFFGLLPKFLFTRLIGIALLSYVAMISLLSELFASYEPYRLLLFLETNGEASK